MRNLNNARKDAGFDISDRINVTYQASDELGAAFEAFADYIKGETLADELVSGGVDYGDTVKIGGEDVILTVNKV